MPIVFRKMPFFVYVGHGIIHRDSICFSLKSAFGKRYGAPTVKSLNKFMVSIYRRTRLLPAERVVHLNAVRTHSLSPYTSATGFLLGDDAVL